ncbi:MAG: L-lactate dehydrogenase [Fulvivirga sp.]|uniref:L-lactate dehydrogenase n=1 Tax=Fulvivirga sp. TaxID=1931237 RepID=UPI0032F03F09
MKNAIGIIGMGWVGSSVAISILQRGICEELLINDIQSNIAEGEAMDLNHGSSFFPSAKVKSVSIKEMIHCRAIVITAGRNGKPGESRLDLLRENANIVDEISSQLIGFSGILIIVANPVDVLTHFYQKSTGLEPSRVIGTGTMLDTARLREMIGNELNVDSKSIHANVIGEHGDSEVVLWSGAQIEGIDLTDWAGWSTDVQSIISHQVKIAAQEIIKRKGATNHAIGLVTATLLKWIFRGERRVVNLSSLIQGPYGLFDVTLSLPSLISRDGIEKVLEVKISDDERDKLLASSEVIKKAILSV